MRFFHKEHGSDKLFRLESLKDDCATFVHTPLFGDPEEVQESYESLKNWKHTKKQGTSMCPAALAALKLPHTSTIVLDEFSRLQVNSFLLDAYMNSKKPNEEMLGFTMCPAGVVTLKKFKKKELQLYPVGFCNKPKDSAKEKERFCVKFNEVKYDLLPFKTFSNFDKPKDPGVLCPFWLVGTTEDENEANMSLAYIEYKGATIPILENKDGIGPNTWLTRPSDVLKAELPAKKRRKA